MTTLHLEKQGESITFLRGTEPGATVVEAELRLGPGALGPDPHRHLAQTETFAVQSGSFVVLLEGREIVLAPGETAVVEPGQSHTFRNGSTEEECVVHCTVEPPLHFVWFLTEMGKVAIRNGGAWRDIPLLEAAYVLHRMGKEYRLAAMPPFVQDILFGILGRLAVLLGRTRDIAPMEGEPSAR
jgi:mannose-6-phosphate isomerase-like protein (cupin superfamily)